MKQHDLKYCAERALRALCVDNVRLAKKWLEHGLGLIEVKPEKKCTYTFVKNDPTRT